ncbi:transcription elongation factor Elf1 like-domain-containing protein [Boletus reticuloceps]|uniref:Transcription elongation factor 1 homolog n=2 Tax=Boletus TaxID=5369 RepID=A0A8I2YST2_9AGAM|nr:transcription elongation factor Elf1 like-domain-containing protein [Boletus edulis]KAF8447949.1 transcription elongation factor Elf1 like-domain-containing protein [Boletus edulis BED1]KAG6376162.1 transcription elongation factor Elf1 like-domain-containing protein [Boletus reticuloceps]
MGKRKKSSRKPAAASAARRREPLDTAFTCLYCHHDKSVTVRLDRKEGIAQLVCRVCDQRYQSKVNHLTEPIDIYSEWIDAADAAQKADQAPRRPTASSSRAVPAAPSVGSDDD